MLNLEIKGHLRGKVHRMEFYILYLLFSTADDGIILSVCRNIRDMTDKINNYLSTLKDYFSNRNLPLSAA